MRYPSTDGISVPAFLYRPRALKPGARAPVVIDWHGGPEAQERPRFYPFAQALVDLGIAVLLPNVRGSDGYGKAYLAADDGVKREQALKDIGATLDFIGRQPGPRPGAGGGVRRQLRGLHDAGLGGVLPRALPGGGGRGGRLEPADVPAPTPRRTAVTFAGWSTATSECRRCGKSKNASRP